MRARAADSPRKGRLILWAALCLFGQAVSFTPAIGEERIVRDSFGSVGMIDMPSARMATDGELSAGVSAFENTQHYNFGFQALPWLETSFRYSGLQHFDPAYPVYYDRSFAIKARLWDETAFFPALAIGVNDIVGTGIYSGEYLVASKRFGSFDGSLGIGWGRLGSADTFHSPLATLSSSFDHRLQYPDIAPGSTSFKTLFHGRASGLFGGVVWHTPIKRLALIAEYSSDTYSVEASRGNFSPRNQMNVGASYQISDNITLGLDWLYGRSVGGNILFALNPIKPQYAAKLGPPPPQVVIRSPPEQQLALQAMTAERHGAISSAQRASINRSSFAETLWQQEGISDVRISGRSLILRANGDAGRRCIIAAKAAQSFDPAITTVQVWNADGRAPVQCVTAAARESAYQNLALISEKKADQSGQSGSASTSIINAIGTSINARIDNIRTEAKRQQIRIEAVHLTESVAIVYYTNYHYFSEPDALDRLTRILMANTSGTVEKFRLIAISNGVPQEEFDILRGPEERKFAQTETLDLFGPTSTATIMPAPMQNPVLSAAEHSSYPRFAWSVYPQLRQELFDPSNPFAVQLTAAVEGSLQLLPGLSLNGEAEASIFDNFDAGRVSNSALPHVRSDFLKYFAQGKTGIGMLDSEYRFRLTPNVFAIAKAGYLESMFAGGGGEILWRPEGQRWALGVDAYEVWQRGFDRLTDLQNYHTFTGHVSLYYASPWHELNFMVSAGQYLAGDRGLTFQVTRRFSTGVEIGAFFTKTNVSAEQFGEGSFDKGIIIRIPLDWALPIQTQGQLGIDLRPVQRDGGQRLLNDAVLFNETSRTSVAGIYQNSGL